MTFSLHVTINHILTFDYYSCHLSTVTVEYSCVCVRACVRACVCVCVLLFHNSCKHELVFICADSTLNCHSYVKLEGYLMFDI